MSPDLEAYLFDRIPKAAREAHEQWPLVDREDFEQEMWLRALASAEMYQRDFDQDHLGLIWRHLKDACRRYGIRDDRDRRARKAAAAGYHAVDEFFYTPKMIGYLLGELIQSEFDLPFAMDRATKGDETGVRVQGGDDTHDAFIDYLTLLVDVKEAFDFLNKAQQNTLTAWFGDGDDEDAKHDHEALAASMGISYDAFRFRKDRALKALLRKLGGETPYIQNRVSGAKAE